MIRPVAIGLSPNLELDDITLALKNIILLKVFSNDVGPLLMLKSWFYKNYSFDHSFPLDSARSGLYLVLKSIGISSRDEVIVPAFTCVAVPNSSLWLGAKPVYADIDINTLSIDPLDFRKKITSNTKAVIFQYTFGIPGNINEIIKIAKSKRIIVIEDCAHIIDPNNRKTGRIGDFSVFSFGRDKAVSSVFGGLVSVNNLKHAKAFEAVYSKLEYSSVAWVLRLYVHTISMVLVLPLYNFLNIGKLILFLLLKLSLINKPVFEQEKQGKKPDFFPAKMHPAICLLALHQLEKVDKFNNLRQNLVNLYDKQYPQNQIKSQDQPLLRYPILVKNREELLKKFKSKRILLGNWYSNGIDPKGSYPITKFVAQHIINLPTYPTLELSHAKKITSIINKNDLL